MSPKTELASVFPPAKFSHERQVKAAPSFMLCPERHHLPHRTVWGRCSPLHCCDPAKKQQGLKDYADYGSAQRDEMPELAYEKAMRLLPRGLEGKAVAAEAVGLDDDTEQLAQAEEALELLKARGANAAREAFLGLPAIPEPPSLAKLGAKEYTRQRLEQVAAYALELRIAEMRFGGRVGRDAATQELLDRAGFTRKPEATPDYRGPVTIVNIGGSTPYDAQISKGVVHVQEAQAGRRDPRILDGGAASFDRPGEQGGGVGARDGAAGGDGLPRAGEVQGPGQQHGGPARPAFQLRDADLQHSPYEGAGGGEPAGD